MSVIIPNDHLSFTSVSDIRCITNPIFKHFNVKYFFFNRYYKEDRKCIFPLCTNEKILDFYLKNVNNTDGTKVISMIDTAKYLVFQDVINSINDKKVKTKYEIMCNYQYEMGMGTEFVIIKKNKNYTDFFQFNACIEDTLSLSRFINNMDLLENFIQFFYEKSKSILTVAYKNKIIFNNHDYDGVKKCADISKDDFLNETRVRNFNVENNSITLTFREIQCAQFIKIGFTGKMIAKELNLSSRTVEMHTESIKNKLSCKTKHDLITFLNTINL